MNIQTAVYLRADGNNRIGLGHVHRLLALGEMLRGSFACKFVIRSPLPGITNLILENGDEIVSLEESDVAKELKNFTGLLTGGEIVVLDGYHFETSYQNTIKSRGSKLVSVDDIHSTHFVSDVVINPAGGVNPKVYSKEPFTQLYTGPDFAFLKKPFLNASKSKAAQRTKSIFICMGGADPHNYTLLTLNQCLNFTFDSYYVVVGEAYLHKEELLAEAKKSNAKIEILSNLKPQAMAEIMTRCSVAVCSASGIAYEYLSVGGELYIRETASNQKLLYHYLCQSGLAFRFEDFRVTHEEIAKSQAAQRKTFDGDSDKRILKIFNGLDFDLHVAMRKAKEDDLMTIFSWANDTALRQQSYNPNPITLESHTNWFTKKLSDPRCFLYIFEYKTLPVAQVRIDVQQEAVISYSIDKMFRGRGWGLHVLRRALETFEKDYTQGIKIVGYVKFENTSSNKVFQNLGFSQKNTTDFPNSYKYEYKSHDRNKSSK